MPELPEVETLRRELTRAVKGQIIKSAQVDWPKMVKPLSVKKFQTQIKNKKILAVARRAKVLILKLSADLFLIIHLKLTGQLIYRPKKGKVVSGGHPQPGGLDNLPNKFTHIIFNFTNGSKLFFNDMRKFGWARLLNKQEIKELEDSYGVEPLSKSFTIDKFIKLARQYPSRKIKQVLLDQKLIAGIGNIYTDESCFCAGIMPTRQVKKIKDNEFKKLRTCLIKILKLSISKGGTSSNTYVNLDGTSGGFAPYLKVYGRKNKSCRRDSCTGTVARIKVAGRGTHYCQNCQK